MKRLNILDKIELKGGLQILLTKTKNNITIKFKDIDINIKMDNELRTKLKSKILDKNLKRSSNNRKEIMMDKNFKKMGIDKEKFKADLEAVKKQGGLSPEQLQQFMNSFTK
jgi:hypothetical protein